MLEEEIGGSGIKTILYYMASLMPAKATWDPVQKNLDINITKTLSVEAPYQGVGVK